MQALDDVAAGSRSGGASFEELDGDVIRWREVVEHPHDEFVAGFRESILKPDHLARLMVDDLHVPSGPWVWKVGEGAKLAAP